MIARRPVEPTAKGNPEPVLQPGSGVLLGRNSLGMWVDVPRSSADFSHPWTVSLAGESARIGKGYVLVGSGAVEPTIGGVPISGEPGRPAPILRLNADLVNDVAESWVCLEVTPDDEGKVLDKEGRLMDGAVVECVQRATPFVPSGKTGRVPLAILVRKENRWDVWQVAMFHYTYTTAETAEGSKHFFV